MNTLATILANLGEFADPALGVQTLGAGVLLYTLKEVGHIRTDLAEIKARLGIIENDLERTEK